MQIQDAQQSVDRWIKSFGGGYFDPLTNLGILMEEVGELSRLLVRKYGGQKPKSSEKTQSISDEIADILWVLLCLSNQLDVDLPKALADNFRKKETRDARRYRGDA